eukprot:4189977-Pyramimonas_sp.AAC.1
MASWSANISPASVGGDDALFVGHSLLSTGADIGDGLDLVDELLEYKPRRSVADPVRRGGRRRPKSR